MRFYHTSQGEKIEYSMPCGSGKIGSFGRISQKVCDLRGQTGGIANGEEPASLRKHFRKCAEVRSDDGNSAKHIFRHHQAKYFAGKRRDDDDVRFRKIFSDFLYGRGSRKFHLGS